MSDGYLASDNNDSEKQNTWKISVWHDQPIVSRKIDKFRLKFLDNRFSNRFDRYEYLYIKASDMPVKVVDNVFFEFFKKHHYQLFISYYPGRILQYFMYSRYIKFP